MPKDTSVSTKWLFTCSLEINFKPLDNRDYQVKVKKSTITAECRSMHVVTMFTWMAVLSLSAGLCLCCCIGGSHSVPGSQAVRTISTTLPLASMGGGRALVGPRSCRGVFISDCSIRPVLSQPIHTSDVRWRVHYLHFRRCFHPGTFSFKECRSY